MPILIDNHYHFDDHCRSKCRFYDKGCKLDHQPKTHCVEILERPKYIDGISPISVLEYLANTPPTPVTVPPSQAPALPAQSPTTAQAPLTNNNEQLTNNNAPLTPTPTTDHKPMTNDKEPMTIPWLWPSILPFHKITALASAPGEGKSLLALDLAARITTGRPLPDGTPAPQGDVLLLSAEDDFEDTILPRFLALGGDPAKLHQTTTLRNAPSSRPAPVPSLSPSSLRRSVASSLPSPSPDLFSLAQHAALDDFLTAHPDIRLVILDPLPAFLGRDAGHSPKSQANLRNHLNALTALAKKHHIAILALAPARPQRTTPTRRSRLATEADPISAFCFLHSAFSSLLLPTVLKDFLRTIWLLRRDPSHPTRRILLPAKTNLTAPPEHHSTFDLTDKAGYPTLIWQPPNTPTDQQPVTNNNELVTHDIHNVGVASSRFNASALSAGSCSNHSEQEEAEEAQSRNRDEQDEQDEQDETQSMGLGGGRSDPGRRGYACPGLGVGRPVGAQKEAAAPAAGATSRTHVPR